MRPKDNFSARANHVWQIPTEGASHGIEDPMTGSVYAETLSASAYGIVAKNAFIYAHRKQPGRNFFIFYRRPIGDMIFDPEKTAPQEVERQDWMERDEEDAQAELSARASDPSSELQESLLELILGFHGAEPR